VRRLAGWACPQDESVDGLMSSVLVCCIAKVNY
jgi:hypothetical protein